MKRMIALSLAALLVCGALPCAALAADEAPANALYPTEVIEHTDGDYPRLEKIYVLNTWEDPAGIPTDDFVREGVTYTLLDLTRQDNVERETKPHTETITLESDSKDMDKILPLLSATREVTTEDGYTGLLTLDTASIKTEASGYGSSTRTVTATRNYPNLSDADVSLIPKTTEDNGRTLTLADVDWQEAGGLYNATATYTGVATSSYVKGYIITADYTGDVSRITGGTVTYTAIFSGAPVQSAETPAQDTGPVTDTEPVTDAEPSGQPQTNHAEEESSGMTWLLALPLCAGIAGVAWLGISQYKKFKTKKEWKEYNK